MRQQLIATASVGVTAPVVLDTYVNPCNVSVAVIASATVECVVQHTFDNVLDATITPTWFDTNSPAVDEGGILLENGDYLLQESDNLILIGEENFYVTIDFPVSAIRLNVTEITGSVTATVLQSGMSGR